MSVIAAADTRTLIDELLATQRNLTPVERFARLHDEQTLHPGAKAYRELLPPRFPGQGEQYAFAVDLDACSGCKACVTACHNLNGLDAGETWRDVGLLHGGSAGEAFQQTVTTACHHCVEPACLDGCPVLAYEKDPHTGIVRHLDDQCIGCQYCILKCPYDVPKYSRSRGIVRKCDMCTNRLAVGEAPACVQACPNSAIRITIANQAAVVAQSRQGVFLPGSPDPAYTQPTTRYESRRGLPTTLIAADAHSFKPGHSHPALSAMLVLTQLSVGAFCVESLLRLCFPTNQMMRLSAVHSLVALLAGLLALGTSTLHLGRPLGAWRSVLGLGTSWLSREIVVFGLFAGMAMLDAGGYWFRQMQFLNSSAMSVGVSIIGLLGVFCSVMIYHDTHREFWRGLPVALKFYGSVAIFGSSAGLFVTTLNALLSPELAADGAYQELNLFLARALITTTLLKAGIELTVFRHLRSERLSALKRAALLMHGQLAEITTGRFLLGIIGGVLLPITFIVQKPAPGFATLGMTFWCLVFVGAGEVLERYLFFTASASVRMPGTIEQ